MAINPESLYPGKIAPSSSAYPYGAARNITTPGDGTGTPWEAGIVNDIFGWQQALLSAAGIVPSGTPDQVGASEYLGAMQITAPSVRLTIAALQATFIRDGSFVFVAERAHALYKIQPSGFVAKSGDITLATGQVAELQIPGAIDARWFGVLNGVESQTGLNDALLRANVDGISFVDIPAIRPFIRGAVVCQSNVTVRNYGKIIIDTNIPAASNLGAFICDAKTRFKWVGGEIDASGAGTYDNNIFLIQDSAQCLFRNVDVIDAPTDRYPLAAFRSLRNSRNRYQFLDVDDVGGIGMQTFEDDDCEYVHTRYYSLTSSKSLIETNDGLRNMYNGTYVYSPGNTVTSAFSFNDKKSLAIGSVVHGGAYNITVGHAAPYEADGSIVAFNVGAQADKIGINIQATSLGIVGFNAISDVQWMSDNTLGDIIRMAVSASKCLVVGNMGYNAQHGVRAADDSLVGMNYFYNCGRPIRPFGTTGCLYLGNVIGNPDARPGVELDFAGSEGNVVIGNLAFDDRGVSATMTYGYDVKEGSMLWANASRGHATAAFTNAAERIANWDIDATGVPRDSVTLSSGTSTVYNNDLITSWSKINVIGKGSNAAASRDPYILAQSAGTITIGHAAGGASDVVEVQIETM